MERKMHWHAIDRSRAACERQGLSNEDEPSKELDGTPHAGEHKSQDNRSIAALLGEDNTCEYDLAIEAPPQVPVFGLHSDIRRSEVTNGSGFISTPIPTYTTSTTTFAHERALRNRIQDVQIRKGGEYDTRAYTPTFIHDCLMLPGSLTCLLGKASVEEIIPRMTPALLPGFHARDCPDTEPPCLLQSAEQTDYVQGMLVFGLGKEGRDLIHKHYRPDTRRIKVEVEIDVSVPTQTPTNPAIDDEPWRLQRRKIWAHAWLWSSATTLGTDLRSSAPRWTFERYMTGDLTGKQSLRIEADGKGDERDDEVSSRVREIDNAELRIREVLRNGYGTLDYERTEGFSGW